MALTATIEARIKADHSRVLDLATGLFKVDKQSKLELASGTGSGQADLIWHDTRSLAGSATEDLDLVSLTDAFGVTATFARIKAILFVASAANVTNAVQVTRPASNGVPLFMAAGDGISLAPGEMFMWSGGVSGKTVTASTGDLITITNSAGTNTVTYDVVIIGASA